MIFNEELIINSYFFIELMIQQAKGTVGGIIWQNYKNRGYRLITLLTQIKMIVQF